MVRLSGPDAVPIARRLFRPAGRAGRKAWASHRLYHGHVVDPMTSAPVDEVLLAYMRAPRTYTGQDVIELSCHGGIAVHELLRLAIAAGARAAERGELTLRAFLSGRLDLAQAEAVADAVDARTPAALTLAVAQLGGVLSARVAQVRAHLLPLYAHLEATIDFDEDDVPPVDPAAARETLRDALAEVEHLLDSARWGQLYRRGVKIALVGRPNVGKSSLLNALLQQERAIVTAIAGTTRDVVEEQIDLLGVPATLADTAGIVETADPVERIGVERSRRALAAADLVVLVLDRSAPLSPQDVEIARSIDAPTVIALNKCDLPPHLEDNALGGLVVGAPVVHVSATEGLGLDTLRTALHAAAGGASDRDRQHAVVSNARHRDALERSRTALVDALSAVEARRVADVLCTDVRAALAGLGEITGESVTEDALAQIFARFCIGK